MPCSRRIKKRCVIRNEQDVSRRRAIGLLSEDVGRYQSWLNDCESIYDPLLFISTMLIYTLFFSPPGRVRSTVMSMSVCLSVCPLAYLENDMCPNLATFCGCCLGHGLVLL